MLVTGPTQDVAPEGSAGHSSRKGLLPSSSEHEGNLTAGTGRAHWEPETKHASLGSQQAELSVWCGLPSPQLQQRLLLPAPTSAQARFIHTGNFFFS